MYICNIDVVLTNVVHKQTSNTSELPFFPWHCTKHIKHHFLTLSKMAKGWRESDMILAANTLRMNPHLKVAKVAWIYHVPPKTLKARLLGQPS